MRKQSTLKPIEVIEKHFDTIVNSFRRYLDNEEVDDMTKLNLESAAEDLRSVLRKRYCSDEPLQ